MLRRCCTIWNINLRFKVKSVVLCVQFVESTSKPSARAHKKPHCYCFTFRGGSFLLFLGERVHHPLGQMALKFPQPRPVLECLLVCQTFTLLQLKRFFQNFTSSEEFSWSVGKASFNIEIPFYLYCTFYYLICAFDNFTLFSFLHYNRN